MDFLRSSSTAGSDLLSSRFIYRGLVEHVLTKAPGPIYVAATWEADGKALLTVEDLGPGVGQRAPRPQPSLESGLTASLLARVRSHLRLRRPTLVGTVAEAILPLEACGQHDFIEGSLPAPPYATFRRMEIGRWIERHAAVLGGEARGDLTAAGRPLPPHDASRPGRSEVTMVADVGRAIFYNTVALWLRDIRWLATLSAARGIPALQLKRAWQALFRVIGIRLPVPDTGILAEMQDAAMQCLAAPPELPRARLGTPAVDFLASFATEEGPLAEYERLRAQGFDDERIFREALTPAQLESGRQWQLAKMSVAEEHRRTTVVRGLVKRSAVGNAAAGGKGCVVAACAPGERHDVGIEMAVTLLRARGIPVLYLGTPVLPEEVVLAAIVHEARAVLLSATMSASVYELIEQVDSLKQDARTSQVPIALGGGPFNELPELRAIVGADAILGDACEALRFCETVPLVGLAFSHSA